MCAFENFHALSQWVDKINWSINWMGTLFADAHYRASLLKKKHAFVYEFQIAVLRMFFFSPPQR